MTFREWRNAWCVIRSIDRHELELAGLRLDDDRWMRFRYHPHEFLIRADDETARIIWSIVRKRMEGEVPL